MLLDNQGYSAYYTFSKNRQLFQLQPAWTAFSNTGSWSEQQPPSGGWQFPRPAFKEQSLFNYIISGRTFPAIFLNLPRLDLGKLGRF